MDQPLDLWLVSLYISHVERNTPMQVTSKRHSMVVEFRPHNILTDKFVYTLKFKGESQSMRLMSRKEMIETVNARLDLHGYTVTDFLTEPQAYSPACCWSWQRPECFRSSLKVPLNTISPEKRNGKYFVMYVTMHCTLVLSPRHNTLAGPTSSNGNYNSNLSSFGDNWRGYIVILEDNAHTSKDTERHQITEYQVGKLCNEAVSQLERNRR